MTRKTTAAALQETVALFMAGRLDEARRACRRLLAKRPDLAEGHLLLAEIHRESGDEVRAGESTARVLRLRPGWSEAGVHLAIGNLLGDFGRYGDAEVRYRRALELEPALADARYNLAGALAAAGRTAESIAELTTLLAHEPAAADARQRLVVLLHQARRFEELEAVCRSGMALHPLNPFYPQRLGAAFWWRGRAHEALAAYRLAADLAGVGTEDYREAKLLEASSLLSLGRYAEGWEAYRWRSVRTSLRAAHPEIVEDPRAIAALTEPKRIRIISEQGLGDELFFLRFAAALRERGHRLIAACGQKLSPLLSSLPQIFDEIELAPAPGKADYALAAGDLPLAARQDFASPLALPVDSIRRSAFELRLQRFGPPPYVGLTWRAGVLPEDPRPQGGVYWAKEIAPELIGAALRPIDARFVVLQRRPPAEEMRRLADALGRPILDLSGVNDDLRDALALLSILDEYVGVSNTNTHLRAAIPGKVARVLVRMPPEWRWGVDGETSPWFPGFKVYRLAPGEDWQRLLGGLRQDLAER